MKTLLMIVFALCISMQTFAQRQMNDTQLLYQAKLEKFTKMKSTGTVLTFVGSALVVVGVITLANSSIDTYDNGYSTTTKTTGHPVAGAVAYLGGAASLGAGIPLWIVGGINKGKYERRLDSLSVKVNVNRQSAGLSFTYKF